MSDIDVSTAIDPGFSHYVIFTFSVCGIAWGAFNAMRVNGVKPCAADLKFNAEELKKLDDESPEKERCGADEAKCRAKAFAAMETTNKAVKTGAR